MRRTNEDQKRVDSLLEWVKYYFPENVDKIKHPFMKDIMEAMANGDPKKMVLINRGRR